MKDWKHAGLTLGYCVLLGIAIYDIILYSKRLGKLIDMKEK